MLDETLVALANLDYLQLHFDARLDFPSGAVLIDGSPVFLLEDLVIEGLTPATAPVVLAIPWPEDLIGRVIQIRVPKPSRPEWHGPDAHSPIEHIYQQDGDWRVRSPALPPEERS
jgi:hypothetical protein